MHLSYVQVLIGLSGKVEEHTRDQKSGLTHSRARRTLWVLRRELLGRVQGSLRARRGPHPYLGVSLPYFQCKQGSHPTRVSSRLV